MPVPVRIKLHEAHHQLEDYQSGVPRWCTGCGDNAILAAVQRLCRDEQLRPEKHGVRLRHRLLEPLPALHEDLRLPRHPRARAADRRGHQAGAARPHVFVNTGDGDCCSIGAAHWIHAIRYNMNLTVMLHDNQIYGLTKKQTSPTSPQGTQEQHHAARQLARRAQPAHRDARRAERLVRRAGRRLDPRAALRRSSAPPTTTAASRSCASCSAAPSGCPRCSSRGCTIRRRRSCSPTRTGCPSRPTSPDLHEPDRARSRRTSTVRARSPRDRPDPGRHPLSQPGGPLLRGPPPRGAAAHGRADPHRPRGGVRQVHHLAAGRSGRTRAVA